MHTLLASTKTQLANFNQQQREQFSRDNVFDLIRQRSHFYDRLLLTLWQQFGLDQHQDLCLIAVGGYGREEMFPLSDLDLLVLCKQPLDSQTLATLDAFFALLWDSKLQLGTAIRTLEECLEVGQQTLSVATNMLESRFLSGNETLFTHLTQCLFSDDFWTSEAFFTAKMREKEERYQRYHNTSYNLEPDLKHSPGGLRDLHLLSWIMLRHFGFRQLDELLAHHILAPAEFEELFAAQTVLFSMRFALHLQLKRYDNRLRLDRQQQLSEQLGYVEEGNQAVEMMMRDYFRATESISQLSTLLLNDFAHQFTVEPHFNQKQPLDSIFYQQDRRIYAVDTHCFIQLPHTILDLFYHLTQTEAEADTHLLRQLRLALSQLSQPLCFSAQARQRFIDIFAQPQMVKRAIVPMHRLGVLAAYFPAWQAITGLMQFDLFHLYTVDEHSVRVMLKLEAFLTDTAQDLSLCRDIFRELPNRQAVFFAALLHDIAKGRGGNHAELGAEDARLFAQLHGFDIEQTALIVFLVKEHLTMSTTAQRRDIHDPYVVQQFATTMRNAQNLAALLCLTVADICATNETLWNDWKGSLLSQLYQFTLQQLNDELNYQEVAQKHRLQAEELLKFALSPVERKRLNLFWQPCPNTYFLRNKPTQLVWHALAIVKSDRRERQLPTVLVSNQYARGATEIFVHCPDQPRLFERLARSLNQKKISIHDAQIITSQQWVYDSFIVTEANGQPLTSLRRSEIEQSLLSVLSSSKQAVNFEEKKAIKPQRSQRPTQLRFLENSDPNQTAFELFTLDREGLLAQISQLFHQQDLALINAKITTIGERVEDLFVISTQQGTALTSEEQQQLNALILRELDGE